MSRYRDQPRPSRAPWVFSAIVGIVGIYFIWPILSSPFPEFSPSGSGSPKIGGAPVVVKASPSPAAPEIKFALPSGRSQAPRFLSLGFTSSVPLTEASLKVTPNPPFECQAKLDSSGLIGSLGCSGFLAAATNYKLELSSGSGAQSLVSPYVFKTMGNKLEGVKWFTEFENASGEPLACAAASIRIISNFTAGKDPMSAEGILAFGRSYNRSVDPGLDPAAIAETLHRLNPADNYHYYNLPTREEATKAAAYWLVRSGKPVVVISLAGQHAPIVTGFDGVVGSYYDDPSNHVDGVIVEDPQRGDLQPQTQGRRPDKYRSVEFQTGRLLPLSEWYGDEWWLRFSYWFTDRGVSMDRSDGAYTTPHWSGNFVIIVDDGDKDNPSSKMGRVKYR